MGAVSEQARRIETKARFELGFERFRQEHPELDYLVIQPDASDGFLFLRGVMEYDSRKSILQYGYETVRNQIKSNFAVYKKLFEKHGLTFREDAEVEA